MRTKKAAPDILPVMLDDGAFMPERAFKLDAGLDIRTPRRVQIKAFESAVIDTGVHVQIPTGYAGVLISKSGLNVKRNLTSTGLIDAGYTGAISVKLYNHGDEVQTLYAGDKVSQLMIVPIAVLTPQQVDHFDESERGTNGFGSTGR